MVAGPQSSLPERLEEALDDIRFPEIGRQAHLARIGKVSPESGRKWMKGESLPSMEKALLLATGLGVSVEWLLTGRGPKKPPGPRTVTLMGTIDDLVPESQVLLQTFANSLAKQAELTDQVAKLTAPWDHVKRRKGDGPVH